MMPAHQVLEAPILSPASTSSDRPRCEPDPLDPSVVCLAKVTADDRQGISHFFGRNKKATQTIPDGIFPILCRTHYQEKQYRWNESAGGLAAFQCDCVLKALERMARKTWVDEEGVQWPYWCGLELQTCKVTDSEELRSDRHPVPGWLRRLCSKEETGQDFIPIGDRVGARYDFLHLASIVCAIKTWCIQNNARLPSVEALPITIGMINEVDLEEAKTGMRIARREYNLVSNQLTRAEEPELEELREELERVEEGADLAQEVLNIARQDSEATKALVPSKRLAKKQKVDTSEVDLDDLGNMSPLKRKRSEDIELRRKKVKTKA